MTFKNPWEEDKINDNSKKSEDLDTDNITIQIKKVFQDKKNNNKTSFNFDKNKFNEDFFLKFIKTHFIKFLFLFFVIYFLTGFYIVKQEEQSVVLRFGKFSRQEGAGLHYRLPYPIETIFIDATTRIKTIKVGDKTISGSFFKPANQKNQRERLLDSLMLTGDENIIDATFEVQWRVKNLKDFVFNVRDRHKTLHSAAQSAIREVISIHNLSDILTSSRGKIELDAKVLLQEILDEYNIGVDVVLIQMLRVDPPEQVINSFRDVQTARVDKESSINRAMSYKNDVVPAARGEAGKILEESNAYYQVELNKAKGNIERFNKIYAEYSKSPYITRRRMYLEAMESVLQKNNVNIVDINAKNLILSIENFDKNSKKVENISNIVQ